jgi:tetratricopeptide (TPR) repeat protein
MIRFRRLFIVVAAITAIGSGAAGTGRPWSSVVLSAQGADLDRLEAAVTAAPDDLRAADDYRKAIIQTSQYDRAIAFFDKLAAAHPQAANAHLNYGFAYVDKIPAAGAITQVILANNALGEFTKSLEAKASWIGYYTRGNSYLFWPRIFGRTSLGIADLNEALKIQNAEPKKSYHARVYVALGDGYWKIDEFDKATATWKQGLQLFPDNAALKERLSKPVDQLKPVMDAAYDPAKRVDTSLQDLWSNQ